MGDTRSLEHRIADELGLMAGPEPPVDSLAVARSVASQAQNRRFTTMFSSMKLVAGVVVIALFGGLLIVSGVVDVSRPPDQAPAIGTSPTPSYTFEGSVLEDDAALFPTGIAALLTGEIAIPGVDQESGEPHVWASSDGGQTWMRSPIADPIIDRIVAWQDGFVAVGGRSPWDEDYETTPLEWSRLWTSADGVSWDEAATLDEARIASIIAVPDGLALLGTVHRPEDGVSADNLPGQPTMWISQDGVDWVAHEITSEAEFDDVNLVGPVRSDDGVWLVGADYEPDGEAARSIVWRSTDLSRWDVALQPEGDSWDPILARTPAGFVVTVASEGGLQVHTSLDGVDWVLAADPGELPEGVEAMVTDSAGPMAFVAPLSLDVEPPSFIDEVPMYRLSEASTWEAVASGIENGFVGAAAMTPEGRLLLVGLDLTDCAEPAFCIGDPNGGGKNAFWIGTPEL